MTDHAVQVARGQTGDQIIRCTGGDLDPEARTLRRQRCDGARDEALVTGWTDTDPEASGVQTPVIGDIGEQVIHVADDHPRALDKAATLFGQAHTPGQADKQRGAELSLHIREAARQG